MKSIRFKILAMAFVITLIVATVIFTYGSYRSRKLLTASNEAYINSLAQELALEMDNFIQLQKGYLEGQVNALSLSDDYSETYLSKFTYNMSLANDFMLYSYFNTLTDEGHFTSSDGWIPPDDYSWQNRYWVKPVSETDSVFVDFPSYDSGTGSIVTVLRKRVYDEGVRGILNMAIKLDALSEKLRAFEIPYGGEAFLIDENGLVVAYHDASIFSNSAEAIMIDALIEGFEKENTKFEIDDKAYRSAVLKDAPWVLWVCVPTNFFDMGVDEANTNFILIYLGTFLVSFGMARAISQKISKPIIKLKAHATFIGQGDFTQEISEELLSQKDEIGEFAIAFKSMRENILGREKELEHNYMEIQALYEEMAASEEALRENYDALNLYKNKVEHYAFHNAQTGFHNRDFLIQTLNKQAEQPFLEPQALLYMSFRELSHYTESMGQSILELIHYQMGLVISEKLMQDDASMLFDLSIGRYAVLIGNSNLQSVENQIEAVKDALSIMNILETLTIKMTLACGGVLIDALATDINHGNTVIEQAEAAMLRNQTTLNHNWCITWFDEEMLNKRNFDAQIETGLFEALKRNEISVVYQPQYNHEGSIIALEALMRWTHGKLGSIPPMTFIPKAESLGVIDQLDQFVIEEVLSFQRALNKEMGVCVPIAVNVSVVELLDPQFVSRVESRVSEYGVNRYNLIFELTETAFSKHLVLVKDTISKLMALGYQVHLDDFGTGYSSLTYLSEFPVNAIKIDRTFVAAFLDQPKFANVIATMVDLAAKLQTNIIAEGVETEAQLTGLEQLGCLKYQGYWFSRPLERNKVIELLNSN